MIAFSGGTIDTDTLYHENMHQWWGDNVTEGSYAMTFFKEGMATFAEFLYQARLAENAAGGPAAPAGRAAFQASLVQQFNAIYGLGGTFWTAAPSNPDPWGLFSGSATYYRPGAAYIALRQILGHANFTRALRQIQRTYGGASISERQLEAAFRRRLPEQSRGGPGAAAPLLHPVVRHGLLSGRRSAPARHHRSGSRRPRLRGDEQGAFAGGTRVVGSPARVVPAGTRRHAAMGARLGARRGAPSLVDQLSRSRSCPRSRGRCSTLPCAPCGRRTWRTRPRPPRR